MELRHLPPNKGLIGVGVMLTGALLLTTTAVALPLRNQTNMTQVLIALLALGLQFMGAGVLLFAHASLGLSISELLFAEFSWGGGASGISRLLLGEDREWESIAIGMWMSTVATTVVVWIGTKKLKERDRQATASLLDNAMPLLPSR